MNEDYDLLRFVEAQDGVYDEAVHILRLGKMCTKYIDFVFPRLGNGDSGEIAKPFAILSLDEARAYLAYPLLGNRYRECVRALTWLVGVKVGEVFSSTDTNKLHASLTLFAEATNEVLLREMLDVWFDNRVDEDTIGQLDLRP